ncbi:MAG: flagellar biosynthesis protein FlhB [Halothiobacillus sp. 20-53-49]|nr:flagellar biosynthesis protein FlhB [Halothiobacillaceae bacterium]OYV47261.1 MAG: flagellar biosynthesis protein FlhB [Halothiobacillus sp. 20-53-49]HUM98889.1 flagellar biosynthesis protein FlhB [Halothiobacillus sp.]
MAENENGQEKTEEPSEKRLQESREKGQVPRSRELASLALTAGSAVVFLVFGGQMMANLAAMMRQAFIISRTEIYDPATMFHRLALYFSEGFLALMPLFIATIVLALAATLLVGGWNFSSQALVPQLNRLNPITGIGRMFSMKSLVELLKTLAKFGLIMAIAFGLFTAQEKEFVGLGLMTLEPALASAGALLAWSFLGLSSGLLIVALIDVPFQLYEYKKGLRMTRQELIDEYKEMEGKPEIKQKIRQLQRQMSQRRMMEAVPDADVIITNPTHFAVALKYQPKRHEAPLVVAKGADEMALNIRKIGQAHQVPLFESPQLARSLFAYVEVDQPIPAGLYTAVAQVLAYIFQIRTQTGGAASPDRPEPVVPDEFAANRDGRPQS